MADPTKSFAEANASASLARIAEALGLPVSHFFAEGERGMRAEDRSKLDDTAVLKLVRTYLQTADPTARQCFVELVIMIADDLSA